MRRKKEEIYAVVDRIFDNYWKPYFRWADSEMRDFYAHGKFETEEGAIADIPHSIKRIVVQYGEVNKTINR